MSGRLGEYRDVGGWIFLLVSGGLYGLLMRGEGCLFRVGRMIFGRFGFWVLLRVMVSLFFFLRESGMREGFFSLVIDLGSI